MNQVLRSAGGTAEHSWLLGLATALFMGVFLGYVVWLFFTKRSHPYLEEAAQIPFEEDD